MSDDSLAGEHATLQEILLALGCVAVAVSVGVDSTLLLYACGPD